MAKLGDVASYINGYAFKPSDWSKDGIPIIRIQDLTGNSYQMNRYNGKMDSKYRVENGDILISWSASLGVYIWKGQNAFLNQHIFKVNLDETLVSKSFFVYQVEHILENAKSQVHGATMKHLTRTVFDALPFYLPTKEKQLKIALELDLITALIEKRKQQLTALDDLVKSRFIEMFGDPVRNPKKFVKRSLKDTCKVITGNTPSREVVEYYGDFVEWIKTDNIVSGMINPTRAAEYLSEEGMKVGRLVGKDAILMACIAGSIASIGRVCVTDRTVAFNQQINAIIPKDYNILFLYVLLQISKDFLVADISMALKGILSKSKLEEKKFIVPPLELQNQFARFVAQADKSKLAAQKGLQELEVLKKSLMQQYFG